MDLIQVVNTTAQAIQVQIRNLCKYKLCKSELCRVVWASVINFLRASVLEPCLFIRPTALRPKKRVRFN